MVIRGYSLVVLCRFFNAGASLVVEGSSSCSSRALGSGSVVVVHGLSCLVACGVFLHQG